jgi:glycosyltransferase involved in cell wall biosynthesis
MRPGLWHNKVIPNPVDVRMFRPQPTNGLRKTLGLQEEDVVVVHTSNLKPIKRPLDLVQLAAMNPDPRLRYVVVGDGPLRAEMERECGARRVSERFRFVGWVAHERVPAFLNLADMVVMPSESEGQALVHLETQACGRLLIASDTPGAREVVRHGETGLLFEKGNVGELAAATAMAAANPMLRQRIGRNAERAVQAHALDVIAAEYEAALRDLIR